MSAARTRDRRPVAVAVRGVALEQPPRGRAGVTPARHRGPPRERAASPFPAVSRSVRRGRRSLLASSERDSRGLGALRTTRSHEPFGFAAVASVITSTWSSSARVDAGAAGDAVDLAVAGVERVVAVAAVERVADLVDRAAGPGVTSPRASAHRSSLPSPPLRTCLAEVGEDRVVAGAADPGRRRRCRRPCGRCRSRRRTCRCPSRRRCGRASRRRRACRCPRRRRCGRTR